MNPSFMEQALSGKLFAEINNGLQCVAANLTLQKEVEELERLLAEANTRIAELTAQLKQLAEM